MRQALGVVLLFLVVLGGRLIRQQMLVGPEGQWKQHLWLDELMVDESVAATAQSPQKTVLTLPLPINSCSQDSLTLLPGVGPVLAERIAAVRDSGTVFRTAQDLEQVKGIGPALSARLAPVVLFEVPLLADSPADSMPKQDSKPANSR